MTPGESSCPSCGAPMVQRRRRTDGAGFLGCSRYPSCRGIRDLGPLPPAPPVRSDPVAVAGASASAEYERRMEKHRVGLPARRRRARVIGAGFLVFALTVWLALPGYWPSAGLIALFGVVIAVAPLAVRQSTQSWGTGADGEAMTAAVLAPLAAHGAILLHDRRIPRSRANIDHIVVCPAGVFVVESKSWAGEVGERDGELTLNRRRMRAVAEARREADAVAAAVAPVSVVPLIAVHRASVGVREVGGVRVLRGSRLADHLVGLPQALSPGEVADLAARIDRALPPARRR